MAPPRKHLIVVGDRVLARPAEGEERTKVGLYLPSTALDAQAAQGGELVATGPGLPMPDLGAQLRAGEAHGGAVETEPAGASLVQAEAARAGR